MSDRVLRNQLIRLAHSLPKGGEGRKKIIDLVASYDAEEIGENKQGPSGVPGSEAPDLSGEFTQQENRELSTRLESGDLDDLQPETEPMKVASDAELRKAVIRLAHTKPEFRPHLLPLLKEAGCEKLPKGPMRDNCEKKKEEGKDKETKKEAGMTRIIQRIPITVMQRGDQVVGRINLPTDDFRYTGSLTQGRVTDLKIMGVSISGAGGMAFLDYMTHLVDEALNQGVIQLDQESWI